MKPTIPVETLSHAHQGGLDRSVMLAKDSDSAQRVDALNVSRMGNGPGLG